MEHNDDRLFEPMDQEPEVLLPIFEEPAEEEAAPEMTGEQEFFTASPSDVWVEPAAEDEHAFGYIRTLATRFWHVPQVEQVAAWSLDLPGIDIDAALEAALG